jgi:hypothetical protein
MRNYLNCTFQCNGRGGEIALLTYPGLQFDTHFRCLRFGWPQIKTGKLKWVHVYPDRESFEADTYHSTFCSLLCSAHQTGPLDFLFPELQTSTTSAATKINRGLTEFSNNYTGPHTLPTNATSKVH